MRLVALLRRCIGVVVDVVVYFNVDLDADMVI